MLELTVQLRFPSPSTILRALGRIVAVLQQANCCLPWFRRIAVCVSLMVAYRATVLLSDGIIPLFCREEAMTSSGSSGSVSTTTSSAGIAGFLLLEIISSISQAVTLVVFLVDWRLRCTVDLAVPFKTAVCGGGAGQCTYKVTISARSMSYRVLSFAVHVIPSGCVFLAPRRSRFPHRVIALDLLLFMYTVVARLFVSLARTLQQEKGSRV